MFTPSGNLFRINQVPEHFKELFILSGYRHPRSSPKQCIQSIFEANNETLNFWTHFIPALYYWYVTYSLSTSMDFINSPYTWPLLAYLLCLCVFPITSATAHIFNTMSDRARHLCFFFDYWVLSLYSVGAAIAYHAYLFPKDLRGTVIYNSYLYIAFINAIVCIIMACETRFMPHGMTKKIYRIIAFGLPYTFDSIPVIYRIIFCEPGDCESEALYFHSRQFIFAFIAAFFYVSHLPERMFPGKFDILGHSHQLFHIFSAVGSHEQLCGLLEDLDTQRHLASNENIPSFAMSLGLMALNAIVTSFVLVYFTNKLYCLTSDASNIDCQGDLLRGSNEQAFGNGANAMENNGGATSLGKQKCQ